MSQMNKKGREICRKEPNEMEKSNLSDRVQKMVVRVLKDLSENINR